MKNSIKNFMSSYMKEYDTHNWFMDMKRLKRLIVFPEGEVISLAYSSQILGVFDQNSTCTVLRSVVEIKPNVFLIMMKDIKISSDTTFIITNPKSPTITYFFVLSGIE